MSGSLYETVRDIASLSLVGLCKNAGKTTALNHILHRSSHHSSGSTHTLALSSIGRDGETNDLVTGTVKPRIYVAAGTIFATAAQLLPFCDVSREILQGSGISTALGEVIVLRARSDGFVQLAGPAMTEQMIALTDIFRSFGADRIIIDGAVHRKSIANPRLAEAIILCSGASCGENMAKVIAETAHLCRVLSLPVYQGAPPSSDQLSEAGFFVQKPDDSLQALSRSALPEVLRQGRALSNCRLFIGGALSDALLRPLPQNAQPLPGLQIVVRDASRIMLAADTLAKLQQKRVRLGVLERTRVAAVVVNPFSAYGHHFDKEEFPRRMADAVRLPVFELGANGYDCTAF